MLFAVSLPESKESELFFLKSVKKESHPVRVIIKLTHKIIDKVFFISPPPRYETTKVLINPTEHYYNNTILI